MDTSLAGKTAIITGAAMGIGRACAELMAAAGAAVVVADIDEAAGHAVVDAVRTAGGQAAFVPTDVGVTGDVNRMAAVAEQTFGGVDILVNNAARALGGVVDEIDEDRWQTVINRLGS